MAAAKGCRVLLQLAQAKRARSREAVPTSAQADKGDAELENLRAAYQLSSSSSSRGLERTISIDSSSQAESEYGRCRLPLETAGGCQQQAARKDAGSSAVSTKVDRQTGTASVPYFFMNSAKGEIVRNSCGAEQAAEEVQPGAHGFMMARFERREVAQDLSCQHHLRELAAVSPWRRGLHSG